MTPKLSADGLGSSIPAPIADVLVLSSAERKVIQCHELECLRGRQSFNKIKVNVGRGDRGSLR